MLAGLAACGGPAPGAADAAPNGGGATDIGATTYERACALCHGSGEEGAPVLGNAEAWRPRLANGVDVLYERAINGYTGTLGTMPPRGGIANPSDDEVRAAVDYMVARVR